MDGMERTRADSGGGDPREVQSSQSHPVETVKIKAARGRSFGCTKSSAWSKQFCHACVKVTRPEELKEASDWENNSNNAECSVEFLVEWLPGGPPGGVDSKMHSQVAQ